VQTEVTGQRETFMACHYLHRPIAMPPPGQMLPSNCNLHNGPLLLWLLDLNSSVRSKRSKVRIYGIIYWAFIGPKAVRLLGFTYVHDWVFLFFSSYSYSLFSFFISFYFFIFCFIFLIYLFISFLHLFFPIFSLFTFFIFFLFLFYFIFLFYLHFYHFTLIFSLVSYFISCRFFFYF